MMVNLGGSVLHGLQATPKTSRNQPVMRLINCLDKATRSCACSSTSTANVLTDQVTQRLAPGLSSLRLPPRRCTSGVSVTTSVEIAGEKLCV